MGREPLTAAAPRALDRRSMETMDPYRRLIERYYDLSTGNEWSRMDRHRTEWAVTLRALGEHLPPPPASLLDCGGGPGRYAIELARQGYSVTLFDLSAASLSFARIQAHAAGAALAGYEQGTATDLARFADGAFEAVLMLGPLYHLTAAADRLLALGEARRVLRPGGVLAAAFISQYAALRFLAKDNPQALRRMADRVEAFWRTGTFPPQQADGTEFIAYFIPPAAVRPLVESAGFAVRAVLGVEGLVSMIDEAVNQLTGPDWEAWVEVNYRAAGDPSLHGACEHLLCIAEAAGPPTPTRGP